MSANHLFGSALAIVLMITGPIHGCASDAPQTSPATQTKRLPSQEAQEAQRLATCAGIEEELESLGATRADILFPYPSPRNQEPETDSPYAEYQRLRQLQARYRCRR